MSISLYTTAELVLALQAMDRPKAFLRDTFFSNRILSDKEDIAIDKLLKRRKMAPFVSPDVPAKERALRGRKVETFQPAYVKPMNTIRPSDTIKRGHGEIIGGSDSPAARRQDIINQTLLDQDDEITRREEWMCAQILRTGAVTVSGEDYETQIVDFQRPVGQTIALTGVNRWGESGVAVRDSIRSWGTTVQKASGGVATEVILGAGAAELLQKDADIREVLDNRRQSTGNMELGPVIAGAQDNPAAYIGSIGQFNFWTYAQWFEDDAGNEVEVWPDFGVGIMAPGAFAGNMAYGAILDMASLVPAQRYPKDFMTDNPSREHLITQAAPLPVPSDVTGSLFALVR